MAKYYSSKQGFFDLKDKETIVLEVEGCLSGIREFSNQFGNGKHIYELVEIKFTNNDVVYLDKGKKWHLSVIRNLVEAYKQGRIFPGVLLKFEIYQNDTVPKKNKMQINRFMRVYIADSPIAEPVNYNEDGYIPWGTEEMIDDLYAKCKAQYETNWRNAIFELVRDAINLGSVNFTHITNITDYMKLKGYERHKPEKPMTVGEFAQSVAKAGHIYMISIKSPRHITIIGPDRTILDVGDTSALMVQYYWKQ